MKLRDTLKEYLQKPYESIESFLNNVIFPVFGEEKYETAGNDNVLRRHPELQARADESGILSLIHVGNILVDGQELDIFDITVNSHRQLSRSRVAIQSLVRGLIGTYSSAFMIFHYKTMEGRWDWRFTFCQKGASNSDSSDAKRYTFLLGPSQSCRTAADNFMKIHDKIEREGELEMDDIVRAFDVEALSKEFFDKYVYFYQNYFVKYMCDEANGMRQDFIVADFDHTGLSSEQIKDKEEKPIRDYLKKLLGRLVFLQFLQKKGWMGVPADKEWGAGDYDFLRQLFLHATPEQQDNFLDGVLEPLFTALDTKRPDDLYDTQVPGIGEVKIPYLNGGLFEPDSADKLSAKFPAKHFRDLFEFFYEYNFTIDENDPQDAEVGVDPEMLGKIFESQLEDNKDKGAFYTPKEIVHYMCKESLIAYLVNEALQEDQDDKSAVEELVRTLVDNPESAIDKIKQQYRITQLQVLNDALVDVKICDPAIGSGAFPMGLLNLLFKCRLALNEALSIDMHPAELKKEIIQGNIYGVDIEKGAIDIARLRFWLSIVVDLDTPEALPNFDYKFMQGNSLLEQYEGIDLSGLNVDKKKKKKETTQLSLEYDEKLIKENIQTQLKRYFTLQGAEKARCKEDINNSVKNYIQCLTEGQGLAHQEQILSGLDVSANDKFFLWHTWFSDVFNRPSKQGFDIVIGNPPYIKELGNEHIFTPINNSTFGQKYHAGKMDYWYYFMHKAIENVSKDGVISFITSRYWINSTGAKKVIKHISDEASFINIVDIGKLKVFNNVVGYHMVSILVKNTNHNQCRYYSITDDVSNLSKSLFTTKRVIKRENLFFKNEIVLEDRIVANTTQTLNDVCNVAQGIVEASDKISSKMYKKNPLPNHHIGEGIFVLSIEEYNFLNPSAEEESIIELFEGDGCLSRYSIDYQKTRRLIYADSCNREKIANDNHFVNIKAHLDNVSEYITSSYKPYGLHRARKYEDFTQPKLIGPSMFINPCYSYDNRNLFVGMSYNIITPKAGTNLFFILGVLNSQYCRDWLYSHAKHRGAGVDVGVDKLRTVPIPIATPAQQQPIIELVDTIIAKKQANPKVNTAEEEQQIDQQVYKLYGLT